ncbi:MAG: hypothetical protein ACJ8AW_06510, partial [Rhodopila sp.]
GRPSPFNDPSHARGALKVIAGNPPSPGLGKVAAGPHPSPVGRSPGTVIVPATTRRRQRSAGISHVVRT